MIENYKIKFPLSVSTIAYQGKCSDWGRVCYRTEQVDIDRMAEYVKQGYCFTHTFKGTSGSVFSTSQKSIANFDRTHTIFIDVDDSPISVSAFYQSVSEPPSMLYTTPSNIVGEKNRYRLVYLFDQPIVSNEKYKLLVKGIVNKISSQISDFRVDTTCMNCSQQMGGNSLDNCILYKNYTVFTFSDFIKNNESNIETCTPKSYKKEERNDIHNRIAENELVIVDNEFIDDFWQIADRDTAHLFLQKYRGIYRLCEATPINELDPFIELNKNYIEIIRRTYIIKDERGNRQARPVRIKKGNRERILFTNALLRLKMQSDLTFENLLYAMVFERQYWIDNGDGAITNKELYKIAKGAYLNREKYHPNPTESQERKRKKNKSGYKVNPAFCKSQGVSAKSMANRIRTMVSNKILMEHYDFSKSVAENSRILKQQDIKPNSERRLYEFLKVHKENMTNNKYI